MPPQMKLFCGIHNILDLFQYFYQGFRWKQKAGLSNLCMAESCGVIVTVLDDRKSSKGLQRLEGQAKTNKVKLNRAK